MQVRKAAIVNQDGLTYREFAATLTPRWRVVWFHIAMGWIAIIVSNLLVMLLSGRDVSIDAMLVAAGSIVIGFLIAYLQLFLHEAVHYNLHSDAGINDVLSNMFIGVIVGQDVRSYRPIHWRHHKYLGTTMDTEITYYDPLNIRFFVEALFGIRAIKVICHRQKLLLDENNVDEARGGPKARPHTFILGFVFNFAYLFLLLYFHQWALAITWTGGILVFFPFFVALRQTLEHRNEYADPTTDYTKVPHGAINRLFGDGPIASTLGGAGFNRHLLHHWAPEVSYTRLRELENYLMGTEWAVLLQESQTTYWATFRRLFHPVWR